MLGKNQIIIDASEFLKGMSSSDDVSDGGFSTSTDQVNLIAQKGSLSTVSTPTAITNASFTSSVIAWCPTNNTSFANGYLLQGSGVLGLDSSQAIAGSKGVAGTFTTGTSDIANFIDKIYVTTTTNIAKVSTDLSASDDTWWGTALGKGLLTSGCRHPLLIYQDRLWVGDLNALHNIVDSGTGNKNVLLLTTENEITALGIDEGSGKMLIAATAGANYSNSVATGNFIFTYDGTSATYTRKYAVDGMVTGFKSMGGITYVTYGDNLGYWNGSGLTFLRKLKNILTTGSELAYKHHLAVIDNTLYVVDGLQILAYGEVLPGRKIFYYAYVNNVNSNKIGLIFPFGGNAGAKYLGIGIPSTNLLSLDIATAGTTQINVYTNKYTFPRPVFIRSIYLEYGTAIGTNDNNRFLAYRTQAQDLGLISLTNSAGTSAALQNTSSGSVYEQQVDMTSIANNKCRFIQFRYSASTVATSLRRMIIYYDPAE